MNERAKQSCCRFFLSFLSSQSLPCGDNDTLAARPHSPLSLRLQCSSMNTFAYAQIHPGLPDSLPCSIASPILLTRKQGKLGAKEVHIMNELGLATT